jgi:hypothetical protein
VGEGESSVAFSDQAYQALEDIVGAKNVSREPAVLDSYAFEVLAELVRPGHSKYMPRPVAVAMPGCTEEVQAIVLLANQYRVKVKPLSTGWYHWAAPLRDDEPTIQLDLRRMNRIVEIDEKNLVAVIEPYVIAGQLQAELIKRGLNLNITGAGASCSILASACAYLGGGPYTFRLGGNSENLLALEWVTPVGDIVRTGSLGSGQGWFCGEGPGPSVRGLCRGAVGSKGGLGVYTKCAIKLSHWPGPTELQVEGTVPAYRLPVPGNFRVYTLAVPSWDAWADLYCRIYDNEIGYIFHRQFNLAGADVAPAFWLMYGDPDKDLSDLPAMLAEPGMARLVEEMRISFQFILAGHSQEDIALQDAILDQILAEVGGWKVERFCQEDMAEFTNMYLVRLGHKHVNFAWAGGFVGTWTQGGTPDFVKGYVPIASAGLARDAEGGLLVQTGGDALMGSGSGLPGGGTTGLEQFACYDPNDLASVEAAVKHMEGATADATANGYPPGKEAGYLQLKLTDDQIQAGYERAKQPQIFRFQAGIKKVFDPNDVGDRMYQTLT